MSRNGYIIMWTLTITLTGIFLGAESTDLRFYHGSLNNFTTTPLEHPLRLLPLFDKNSVSIFYVFGFNGTVNNADAKLILSSYLKAEYTNVLLLDWMNEAHAPSPNVTLSYINTVVPNAKIVGRAFGTALVKLFRHGIHAHRIHVVGHSLGAHVAGYCGDAVNEYNIKLGRITGLDPAGPIFDDDPSRGGLSDSAAEIVDVIHTDPTRYGTKKSIGTVDFWINCEDRLQPGCPDDNGSAEVLSTFCSHERSVQIFSEAILSPTSVIAVKAHDCTSWQSLNVSLEIIYLGDLVNTCACGNYYLSTTSNAPFSKRLAGVLSNQSS